MARWYRVQGQIGNSVSADRQWLWINLDQALMVETVTRGLKDYYVLHYSRFELWLLAGDTKTQEVMVGVEADCPSFK